MEDVQEIRYPFESFIDFVSGGYWTQIDALHLALGWFGLIVISLLVLFRKSSLYIKFSTIYFAGFIFNNPAYNIAGVRFSEFFGIFAVLTLLCSPFLRKSLIGYSLLLTVSILFIHIFIIYLLYPEINAKISDIILRIMIVGKVLILAIIVIGFDREFNTEDKINQLIKDIVYFALVGVGAYLTQLLLLLTGNSTFGTFADAGFTGFPSFGSVSIERGHFAKLFVPLFPFFAILLIKEKNWLASLALILYFLISLINFSASGQFFLFCYIFLVFCFYKKSLFKLKYFLLSVFLFSFLFLVINNFLSKQFIGIIEKVTYMGLMGDGEGGRGFDVFIQYNESYPLGTSYGGSQLRTVGSLPEINMGIYAFIAQLSILVVPLIIGFIYLNYIVIVKSRHNIDKNTRTILVIGMLTSGIIYCVDILWFTPTIWLPLIICNKLSKIKNPKQYHLTMQNK